MKKYTKIPSPKLLVGLLFVAAGVGKLFIMGPAAFAGALEGMLGLTGGLALVAAWLVGIFELLGGLALVLSCKLPCKKTYKILVSILVLIMLVAIIFVDIFGANFDAMGFLKNLIVLSILVDTLGCVKKCVGGKCDAEEKEHETGEQEHNM